MTRDELIYELQQYGEGNSQVMLCGIESNIELEEVLFHNDKIFLQ